MLLHLSRGHLLFIFLLAPCCGSWVAQNELVLLPYTEVCLYNFLWGQTNRDCICYIHQPLSSRLWFYFYYCLRFPFLEEQEQEASRLSKKRDTRKKIFLLSSFSSQKGKKNRIDWKPLLFFLKSIWSFPHPTHLERDRESVWVCVCECIFFLF